MNPKVIELLEEMTLYNPRPEEKWFREDDYDPRFSRAVLRDAERSKRIEIDRSDEQNWQFRFTAKGREDAESL